MELNKLRANLALFGSWITAVAVIVGAIFGLASYIDYRITVHLDRPETVQKIASAVRPALIFDSDNRIFADQGALAFADQGALAFADQGALAFIKQVKFLRRAGGPPEVVVTPKTFLSSAPLLESLDVEGYQIEAIRGEGLTWRYVLRSHRYIEPGVTVERFRLEVLR